MEIEELKKKYNKLIATEKKAEAFFNNPNESMERKEKWLPKFQEITRELSMMMKQYCELTGKEMMTDEVLNGFKE
jgi:FtsZ-binding cell division protein ZapB